MIPMKVTCCYKCEDRYVIDGKTCHSTCSRYLESRRKLDEQNEAIRKQKDFYRLKNNSNY